MKRNLLKLPDCRYLGAKEVAQRRGFTIKLSCSLTIVMATMLLSALQGVQDPAFTFYNIMPYAPGKEDVSAQDMIEYRARTGNDICLYSLSLHAEGLPATAKADEMAESFRKLKQLLNGSGVKLGVLMQSSLGHWLRKDTEQERWTRTVDIKGNEKRFCPFDPNLRAYITGVVRKLTLSNPCMIMIDDDVRAFSPEMECFCPLHVAEFNRRTGKNLTSQELRAAVLSGKKGDANFDAFVKLQRDTLADHAGLIRSAIDSVDPSIPGAACMPGWPFERAWSPRTARAIAAKGQEPILRIANAYYCESTPDGLAPCTVGTMACLAYHAGFPRLLDESDSCPHNLWSKSASTLHQKLVVAAFCGLSGSKIWFVNGHRSGRVITRHYTDMLEKYRGYHVAVAEAARGTELMGLITPVYRSFPLGPNVIVENGGWAGRLFGKLGVPFRCEIDLSKDGIWSLSGAAMVRNLSDDDLKQILSHRVLLDPLAAMELTKRGMSNLTGVKATDEQPPPFSCENVPEIALNCAYSARWTPPVKFSLEPGAEPFAYLVLRAYAYAEESKQVMPSGVLFRNSLGGTVAVTVYNPQMHVRDRTSEARQEYLAYVIGKLGGPDSEYLLMNPQPAQLLVRRGPSYDLLSVMNYCYDAMENVSLRCARPPRTIERLDDHGTWRPTEFRTDSSGRIVISGEVPACGAATYRCFAK